MMRNICLRLTGWTYHHMNFFADGPTANRPQVQHHRPNFNAVTDLFNNQTPNVLQLQISKHSIIFGQCHELGSNKNIECYLKPVCISPIAYPWAEIQAGDVDVGDETYNFVFVCHESLLHYRSVL